MKLSCAFPASVPGSQTEDSAFLKSWEYSILVPLAYGPVPHKTTAGKVTPLSFDVGHAFYRDTAIQSVRLEFDPLPAETLQSDSGKSTLVDALTRKLSENINLGQLLRKAECFV